MNALNNRTKEMFCKGLATFCQNCNYFSSKKLPEKNMTIKFCFSLTCVTSSFANNKFQLLSVNR